MHCRVVSILCVAVLIVALHYVSCVKCMCIMSGAMAFYCVCFFSCTDAMIIARMLHLYSIVRAMNNVALPFISADTLLICIMAIALNLSPSSFRHCFVSFIPSALALNVEVFGVAAEHT